MVPLWASLTHQLPSTASLVGNDVNCDFIMMPPSPLNLSFSAAIMVLVGLFVIHGLGLIREKSDRPTVLTYLPPGLFTMAALLALLQPEFNLAEVSLYNHAKY